MISKRFIKSSLVYTVAGALPLASGFILLPFYITYLSDNLYGALVLCTTASALVQIIASYSFDTSVYIHFHELRHDREKLGKFIGAAFVFILMLGGATILLSAATGDFIFSRVLKGSLSFFPYGMMAIVTGVFQAIFKVYTNLLQTRGKHETFFWANVISFTVIVAISIVGLQLYPKSLLGPMGGRLISGAGIAIWVLVRVFREYGFHFISPWKDTSFSFNGYTFLYQLQQWAINYVHQFVILFSMPKAAIATVGIFEFGMKCMAPLELLLNGLNATINPKVVRIVIDQPEPKSSTPEMNRYFYGLVAVMLITGCAAIVSFPFLIHWFVKKNNFVAALEYLPYIAMIFVAKAVRLYFVVPFTALKRMKELMILNLVVTILKAVVMIFMVRTYGVYGVVITTIMLFAFELVLLRVSLAPHLQMKFNAFKLIIVPYLMIFAVIVIELMITPDMRNYAHLGYALTAVLLLGNAYRNEIQLLNPFKLFRR